MLNFIINGAMGKMGKKVFDCSKLFEDLSPICGVDICEDFSEKSFPIFSKYCDIKEKADFIIDFSSPNSMPKLLDFAFNTNTPLVICTTGLNNNNVDLIKKYSKNIPIFYSANMSLGLNILASISAQVSQTLKDFDIEIIEKHHNKKIDSPSGSALLIADSIKKRKPNSFYTFGRHGENIRLIKEIGIHSIRCGNIVGEHQVIFAGENEIITITHQATDRSVFAIGALKAGIFISRKNKGLYNMLDLLKA